MKKISSIISNSTQLSELDKKCSQNNNIKTELIKLNKLFQHAMVHFSEEKLSIFMSQQSDAYFAIYSKPQIQDCLQQLGIQAKHIEVKIKP